MTARRLLVGAVAVLIALVVQSTVLARLPLPGGAPDLLLVLVVALALAEGSLSGTVTGFVAGLLADLGADHELGRLAVVYTLVGYVAGALRPGPVRGEAARSLLLACVVVALAAVGGITLYAAEGLLLGDPRITGAAYLASLAGTVPYSVVLTLFVVPAVRFALRRVDPDPQRR